MLSDPQTIRAQLASSVAQLPLLFTKFAPPPARPDLVARPRLLEQLERAARHKCTLVAAPAGFGKTTAISAWAAASPVPVAWLALDPADNDPLRFWTYVITALDMVHAGVAEPALALLQSPQPPPVETILTAVLNALSTAAGPLVLVLDDYHAIEAPAIHQRLSFLLDHLEPHVHLVIASRRNPPLPLGRERARGGLAELRAADLRFTAGEVGVLFNEVCGQRIGERDLQALAARTEGWIAGLQLVALALPGQRDIAQFIATLSGSDRHLVDYLIEEVLERQPPALQTFLLETSILSQLCGPLCDAVTGRGDSQTVLEQLEQEHLFIVPLDRSREWYRYHQLFAEFLRARLQHERPSAIPELQRRAALWYAGQERYLEAIGHALAGDDPRLAAGLIDRHADTVMQHGEVTTLLGWLAALPDDALRAHPRLYLVHAWALLASSQYDAAKARLDDAEHVLRVERGGASEGAMATRRGELTMLRATVAAVRGDAGAARALQAEADAVLEPDNPIRHTLAIWILGFLSLAHGDEEAASRTFLEATSIGMGSGSAATILAAMAGLGSLQLLKGNLRDAARVFEGALRVVAKPEAPPSPAAGMIYLGLSKVRREYNDLPAAQEMALQSIELSKRAGNARLVAEAYLALARVQRAQGNLADALSTIRAAEAILQQQQNRLWMRSGVMAERLRIWLARGELMLLSEWARVYRPQPASASAYLPPSLFQQDLEELMLVRVLTYQGRRQPSAEALREARRLVEAFLRRAEQARSQERVIEATLLLALVSQAMGEQQPMLEQLGRALGLAAPSGYVRLFLDEGEPMLQALQSYERVQQAQRGPEVVDPAYLRALIGAATGGAPGAGSPAAPAPSRPARSAGNAANLSERELEVLRLVVSGATTAEIADALMIAPGTVKRHLHSIYGKLDARNRVQVLERARALNLL